MTLSEKQRQFVKMAAELIIWAYEQGYELTFGEALRTPEQQDIYLQKGFTKTKDSKHLVRLAIDLNLFINGQYVSDGNAYIFLGEKWESIGGRWGGRFGVKPEEYANKVGWDANHFEWKEAV